MVQHSLCLFSPDVDQRITLEKAWMGEQIFISFPAAPTPYQTKMHNYYLDVSNSLDQEIGHEPLINLESNVAVFHRSLF